MQIIPVFEPAAGSARAAPTARRLVVDAPMRMFHWLFALSFVGAYLTADGEHWRALHVTLGYTMAGLLAFRIVYGLVGPREARISLLWRRLTGMPAWLRSVAQSRSLAAIPWRQGQNLAMALAVAALLAIVVPLTISGYGSYNDWSDVLGGDWLEELHEFFGEALLAVVLIHLALITLLSLLRRRNQALPMLTGRIEGAGPDLVKRNRAWLAGLMLVAVLAFAAMQWRDAPNGLLAAPASSGAHASHHHDDDD
jgi:cytochrome b